MTAAAAVTAPAVARKPGSLAAVVTAELGKLVRRPAVWVLLGLWPSVQMVFSLLIPYISYQKGSSYQGSSPQALLASTLPDRLVLNSLSGLPLFGGALVLALGALLAGSEYGWGTMKSLLTQGPRRLTVLAGQLLALLVALAVTVVVSLLLTAAGSWAIAGATSSAADWPGPGEVVRGFLGGLLVGAVWGTLGFLLGTLFRSTALPIGLGLVWVLAIENLVVNVAAPLLAVVRTIEKALPGVNAGSLVASLAVPGAKLNTPGVAAIVPGPQSAWVLAGFLVVFTALTGLLVSRRDVT